jgi:hypothetical protein
MPDGPVTQFMHIVLWMIPGFAVSALVLRMARTATTKPERMSVCTKTNKPAHKVDEN